MEDATSLSPPLRLPQNVTELARIKTKANLNRLIIQTGGIKLPSSRAIWFQHDVLRQRLSLPGGTPGKRPIDEDISSFQKSEAGICNLLEAPPLPSVTTQRLRSANKSDLAELVQDCQPFLVYHGRGGEIPSRSNSDQKRLALAKVLGLDLSGESPGRQVSEKACCVGLIVPDRANYLHIRQSKMIGPRHRSSIDASPCFPFVITRSLGTGAFLATPSFATSRQFPPYECSTAKAQHHLSLSELSPLQTSQA